MRHFSNGRIRQQFRFLRRQFLQDDTLPLSNVLSEDVVAEVLEETECSWVDRIYSPLVTVWVFLGQVLSADHSCRWAVSRLIVQRLSQGQSACSAKTGAYCRARKRLPEKLFSEIARKTGQELDANAREGWLWKDRPVYIFDGTTVVMPDTAENQKAYPQVDRQKPGLGFPMARIVAIFSLSCGAVVELAIGRYAGKAQGELSLFRTIWDVFRPGDIVLTDAFLCTWTEIQLLQQRGIDYVGQLHVMRKADLRRGKRLGKKDHICREREKRVSRDRFLYASKSSIAQKKIFPSSAGLLFSSSPAFAMGIIVRAFGHDGGRGPLGPGGKSKSTY